MALHPLSGRRLLRWCAVTTLSQIVMASAIAGPIPDFSAQSVVTECLNALPPCLPDLGQTVNTVGGASLQGGAADASAFADPVIVQASATGGDGNTVTASSRFTYFLEYAGPALSPASLPVEFSLVLKATINGNDANSLAGFDLYLADTLGLISALRVSCFPGACDPSFDQTLVLGLTPNTLYEVDLTASAHGLGFAGSQEATALADPHIFVDPSFTDAGDYTLLLSDGVGNELPGGGGTGTAPEPTTLALLGIGLAGFGFSRYRRKPNLAATNSAARGLCPSPSGGSEP